jgi:AraC-like DNA-binding protein
VRHNVTVLETSLTLDRPGPVVIAANWYRFRSGERFRYAHVGSVSYIWVLHGSGTIVTGGREFAMPAQAVLVLPWMHDVDYRPDDRAPFQVGTIHLVPRHAAGVPVEPRVPFLDRDPLLASPHRFAGGPRTPILSSRRSARGRRVVDLATYAVERFDDGFDASVFGRLGDLILRETEGWSADAAPASAPPTVLGIMTEFAVAHLADPLTLAGIAAAGGCSPATAERLFVRHTGLSALAWVREQRMRAAAQLLRTTGLRVNEVARQVGYSDPLYFSRVFRAAHAVPPSRYARDLIRP